MKIINTTPHDIVFFSLDGLTEIARYPTDPEQQIRVSSTAEARSDIDGLPARTHVWDVPVLPPPQDGVLIAVSTLVADRVPLARRGPDIIIPDSGPDSAVRDGGQIRGVRYWTVPYPACPV